MKRTAFLARVPVLVVSSALIVLAVSCAAEVIRTGGIASLVLTVTIPPAGAPANPSPANSPGARILDPAAASIRVLVERGETTVAEQTASYAAESTVSCLNASGLVLREASSNLVIDSSETIRWRSSSSTGSAATGLSGEPCRVRPADSPAVPRAPSSR